MGHGTVGIAAMGSVQRDVIVNEVQRQYNGLGQMTAEFQEHSGAVNLSTSPKVQYNYSEMSGGANHSRLISMTYPNGRVLSYNYATGLDDAIGRLSSISDTSATLESYTYIGLGTLVKRAHPQTGVDLTYIGSANGEAGDIYVGLDRFARVADQRWATGGGVDKDRFQYGYDRNSNRLYELNTLYTGQSELYGYDGLNRLASFKRGTLSDVNGDGTYDTISGQSKSQSWGLDALGNWSTVTTDASTVTREHDAQNRLTDYDTATGGNSPDYDANGNMILDQLANPLVYDAWNRLVKYDGTAATFAYDALGRRVRDTRNATTTDLYHSAAWQVVEERVGTSVKSQFVWSPAFVDAMICRDRDADANAGNGLEERLYPTHDANFNITSLLDASGNTVERYTYLPYGERSVFDASMNVRSSSAYNFTHGHQSGSHDLITGLIHFRHREYSTALGRWVQQDPMGYVDGMSLYEHIRSSPIAAFDPFGDQASQPATRSTVDPAAMAAQMQAVYDKLAALAKNKDLLDRCKCDHETVKKEAALIAKTYVNTYHVWAKPYHKDIKDERAGWMCSEWMTILNRELKKLNLKCWTVTHVANAHVVGRQIRAEHNYVFVSLGDPISGGPALDAGRSLDPWKERGPQVYSGVLDSGLTGHQWNYIPDADKYWGKDGWEKVSIGLALNIIPAVPETPDHPKSYSPPQPLTIWEPRE